MHVHDMNAQHTYNKKRSCR